MVSRSELLVALESLAPKRFAFSGDPVGLQLAALERPIQNVVVALDHSMEAAQYAAEQGAEVLLTHHPLFYRGTHSVTDSTHDGRVAAFLLGNQISHVSAHTNWDSAQGGISDALAAILGLQQVASFGMAAMVPMRKITFFAPEESVEELIHLVTGSGKAGRIGHYSDCAFVARGEGHFRAEALAEPYIGLPNASNVIPESRVEIVCPAEFCASLVQQLREAHPYETPAIDVVVLEDWAEQPAGRIGHLAEPMNLSEFAAYIDERLDTRALVWGKPSRNVSKVAVVGGAADGDWENALREEADVFVTGEVRHHIALEASEAGMGIVAAGHFATEHPGCAVLRDRLAAALPEVAFHLFTPPPGRGARPLD